MASPSIPLLLVLAWDAADPALRRGGAAPPPLLPWLRLLAARRPLLAVVPQLPGGVRLADLAGEEEAEPTFTPPPSPFSDGEGELDSNFLELETSFPSPSDSAHQAERGLGGGVNVGPAENTAAHAAPGVLLLSPQPSPQPAPNRLGRWPVPAPPFASRLIGVVEALGPDVNAVIASVRVSAVGLVVDLAVTESPAASSATLALRVPLGQRTTGWQAPAAPYVGSAVLGPEAVGLTPAVPAVGPITSALAAASGRAPAAAPQPAPAEGPATGAPSRPAAQPSPDGADEFASAETGPAEAADLSAEAPDTAAEPPDTAAAEDFEDSSETYSTTPEAVSATLPQALHALRRPEASEAPETLPAPTAPAPFALADDLHYRLIQYARFAVPLVEAQQQPLGLVYAADWPTWLAALEMRYRCRCPLVLHLTALAADEAAPAAAGWLLELERYALRRAHTVLVPNEVLRLQVLAAYPALPPGRVLACDVADAPALAAALAAVVSG